MITPGEMERNGFNPACYYYAGRILAGNAPMPEVLEGSLRKAMDYIDKEKTVARTIKTDEEILAMMPKPAKAENAEIDLGITEVVSVQPDAIQDDPEVAQIMLSEWIGQRKFSAALQKLLTVSDLVELNKIKETKAYKGLKIIVDGKPLTVSSFSEVCRSIGASEQHINEQLLNLRTFGPEFLEFSDRSLGYRDLRALRKLPDDQHAALRELAQAKDTDALVEFVEKTIEAHLAEKQALTEAAAESAEEVNTFKRREKNYDAEIERLSSQVTRLSEAKKRTTSFTLRTEEIREECMALQFGAGLNLDSLQALFDEVNAEGPDTPEWRMQIEQIWVVAHTVAARALDMVAHFEETVRASNMPERVMGEHILTAEEAERWLHDAPLIANKFEAEKLARQEKRDAEKPRGRGRPAGSTNKAKD